MNDMKEIRFALPLGSLNSLKPGRACTKDYLDAAGLYTTGYEPDSREFIPTFTNVDYLHAVAIRPQRVPIELCASKMGSPSSGGDIGITGGDWAAEGAAAGNAIKRLCSLGYGKVSIYVGVRDDLKVDSVTDAIRFFKENNKQLLVATEYIHRTAEMLMSDPAYTSFYGERPPEIEIGGRIINKEDDPNPNVRVTYSEGTTELNIPSGFAQMIVENAGSGRTAHDNKIKRVGDLGRSCAGIYVGPHITIPEKNENDIWWDRIDYVTGKLMGAALSKLFNYYIFNFPVEKMDEMNEFLTDEKLFTVKPIYKGNNKGGNGIIETSILVPKDKDFVVVAGLKKMGGQAVVTISPDSLFDLPWDRKNLDEMLDERSI